MNQKLIAIRHIPGIAFDKTCYARSESYIWEETPHHLPNDYEMLHEGSRHFWSKIRYPFIAPVIFDGKYRWDDIEDDRLLIDYITSRNSKITPTFFEELGSILAHLHALPVDEHTRPHRRTSVVAYTKTYAQARKFLDCPSDPLSNMPLNDSASYIHGRFSASMISIKNERPIVLTSFDAGYGSPILDLSQLIFELWEISFITNVREEKSQNDCFRFIQSFIKGYQNSSGKPFKLENLRKACFGRACAHALLASFTQKEKMLYTRHLNLAKKSLVYFDYLGESYD